MTPGLRAKLELYRDVEPSNVIVFKGLDQLRAMQRDATYEPKALNQGRIKEFRTR